MTGANPFEMLPLGEGYYLMYRITDNDRGGYHPVDITLCRGEGERVRGITDRLGNFKAFPSAVDGAWYRELVGPLYSATLFQAKFSEFVDGRCLVSWMVQPDGRYFADDDGFGMEPQEELWLYAEMDQTGRFLGPFTEEEPAGYEGKNHYL